MFARSASICTVAFQEQNFIDFPDYIYVSSDCLSITHELLFYNPINVKNLKIGPFPSSGKIFHILPADIDFIMHIWYFVTDIFMEETDMLIDCIFVGLGGAIGAVGRYLIGLAPIKHESGFPVSTLLINVTGAFIIGMIAAIAGKNADLDPRLVLFLKVGICGGFTTFSTFSLETFQLLQGGKVITGLLYIVLSILLCLAAVICAQMVCR